MDILFLSVAAGGGHMKAAESVKEVVEQKYPGSRCFIVDTLRYVNPVVDKLVIGSYLNSIKKTPQIYGMLYEMSESGENIYDFSEAVNKLMSFKVKTLIKEFKPSVVVCTHAFPLQMMSTLKKKRALDVPVLGILTDFAIHPLWIHDKIDAYVVSNDLMKYDMVNKGISQDIIFPYGIPVSSRFREECSRDAVLEEMELEDKLTFLLMGGSLGFGEIKGTFRSLLKSKRDIQIVTIAGNNTKLRKQLERYSLNTEKKVKVLSYTDKVAELMSASDFIITKPGGMTISEALIKGLPMLLISPIPGQEERNEQFLVNYGAAVRISDSDSIDSILFQVLDNPLKVRHMKEMGKYLSRPEAAYDIVNLLERMTE